MPVIRNRFGAVAFTAVLALLFALTPGAAFAANPSVDGFTPPDDSINKTTKFEGCIQDGSFTLPTDFGGTVGDKFACPDDSGNDSNYTPGSLSGWNELDFVPFFLRMENTSNSPSTFNMIIGADNSFKGVPGYTDISVPEIFRSSATGCSVSSGPVEVTDKVTGGADTVIYRVLTITLPANGTCQMEWYNTIGLGASGIPGKSMQAYVFDQADFKGGKRTISLGVDLPQQLSKTMSAVQGSNHSWTVTKTPSPSTLTLDTCEPDGTQGDVDVTVTWTKQAATPGAVSITTTITATNTAARPLDVQVNDKIYATETDTLIDEWTSDKVTIPAKSSYDFVHTYSWTGRTPDVKNLNDVATASYFDPEGTQYKGNTTAEASAKIMSSPPTNASATITDTEKLVGVDEAPLPEGVQFSSEKPAPVEGTFTGGYVPGTRTTGPVEWTSGAQNASGSTTFPKTVYVPKGLVGNAQLVDTASLKGSDGLTTTADAAVNIVVQTNAKLTVSKTIPDVLTGEESATFTFDVLNSSDEVVADDVPMTFTAGETSESFDVGGLAPDVYTVKENTVPEGWDPAPAPQVVDLRGDACAGTAPFENTIPPATAKAIKVTDPAGQEGGWDMTLTRSGSAGGTTVTTNSAGEADFGQLAEGTYTISETMKEGWEFGGQSGDCEFTVDYPRDGGKTFSCVLTNRAVAAPTGSVTISKEFNSLTSGFTGTFDIEYTCVNGGQTVASGKAPLGNGQSQKIDGLPIGTTCTVTEPTLPAAPAGWTFNPPTFVPSSGQATVTTGEQDVTVRVINSISRVSPVAKKKLCPIQPTVVKKVKKDGNRVLIKKVKTKKSSCVLLKPVVLCKPVAATAAGETAFCKTKVTKRGRITVNTNGYAGVKVRVIIRSKPKPGFEDQWKPNTWRKTWTLK